MKSTFAFLLATAFLVGCDHGGTAPTGTGTLGAGGSGNNGGTGGGGGGGGGGSGGGNNSLLDSTELNGPIPANALVGGQKRALVFYYPPDRELHIQGTSDGDVNGLATGPETIWDVWLHADDTLYPRFTTQHEAGLFDSIYLDTTTYKDVHIRMYTDVGAMDVLVQSNRGATINVIVQAFSGVNNQLSNWSPPRLPDSTTAKLVFPGGSTTPIGLTNFQVTLPVY